MFILYSGVIYIVHVPCTHCLCLMRQGPCHNVLEQMYVCWHNDWLLHSVQLRTDVTTSYIVSQPCWFVPVRRSG